MKKLLLGIFSIAVLILAGYKITEMLLLGGKEYYVQITTVAEKKELPPDDTGKSYMEYSYSLTGYDKNGNGKQLYFTAVKERPLRKEAYLKVIWNKKKGVTSYEEVTFKKIPEEARQQLLNDHK